MSKWDRSCCAAVGTCLHQPGQPAQPAATLLNTGSFHIFLAISSLLAKVILCNCALTNISVVSGYLSIYKLLFSQIYFAESEVCLMQYLIFASLFNKRIIRFLSGSFWLEPLCRQWTRNVVLSPVVWGDWWLGVMGSFNITDLCRKRVHLYSVCRDLVLERGFSIVSLMFNLCTCVLRNSQSKAGHFTCSLMRRDYVHVMVLLACCGTWPRLPA